MGGADREGAGRGPHHAAGAAAGGAERARHRAHAGHGRDAGWPAEAAQRVVANVDAIDRDGTGIRIAESGDEAGDRGLAATGGACNEDEAVLFLRDVVDGSYSGDRGISNESIAFCR
mgnify:CR=1 FL=1